MLARDDLVLWSHAEAVDGRSVPRDKQAPVRVIAEWAAEFLVQGHALLGRKGAVCPYTKPSIDKELFHLACVDRGATDAEVLAVLLEYRDWHEELAVRLPEPDRRYLTVLVVLPDEDPHDPAHLDELQEQLKISFVRRGLMVGQFHPRCEAPGLWSPDFRPLRSPVPLLAIRHMVPFDLPFLQTAAPYLDAYLENFAPAIPASVRARLAGMAAQDPASAEAARRESV